MKALLLSLTLLTGCTTIVPVKQNFPPAPPTAQQTCAPLIVVPSNAELSVVANTVNLNYQMYWQCALKVDAWTEWYKTQKSIYEGIK
jgi:hypothetical protein